MHKHISNVSESINVEKKTAIAICKKFL